MRGLGGRVLFHSFCEFSLAGFVFVCVGFLVAFFFGAGENSCK